MPSRRLEIHPVVAVTIAASDSSGGAGIQADLATFAAHGVYGASVLTAATAQSTRGISATEILPPAFVTRQMDAVFSDLSPRAVKIGALGNASVVRAVARSLVRHQRLAARVVLDPVLAAKDGSALLAPAAIPALLASLFPLCDLVTPNLPEAEALAGIPIRDESDRRLAAGILADAGAKAVLVKGGHGRGPVVDDLLFDGRRFTNFKHRRIGTRAVHGTGCTLSAAIAANLALGGSLREAIESSTAYLEQTLERGMFTGRGRGVPGRFLPARVTPRRRTGRRASRRHRSSGR